MFGLKCLLNYSGIRGTSNRHLIRHGNYRSYMVFDRVLPTVSICVVKGGGSNKNPSAVPHGRQLCGGDSLLFRRRRAANNE